MVSTTIVDGNVYITTGTVSGNTITHNTNELVVIHSTKIDQNLTNEIRVRPITVSKGRTGEEPVTQIVDLKIITESLNVNGVLDDETNESANTKRENLVNLAKLKRELTVVWGTTPYQTIWKQEAKKRGVFVQKIIFTETSGIIGENVTAASQPDRNIALQINLVRGKDI